MTGVVTKKPEILSNNRFHRLQHLNADDSSMADTNTKESMQNMRSCINQPILAKQVKNKLVGKKQDVCNMIFDLEVTSANQSTPKDCLSMHQFIRLYVQSRNSEPQYLNSSKESLTNAEYDAPYDHMLHQTDSQQNTKQFGFLPKSALKTYEGEAVQWDKVPDILQAHRLIKDSKLPNFLHCRIPVQSGLNIKAWRHYLKTIGTSNYLIYLSLVSL